MSYTRDQWSRAFLAAIGNTAPNQQTVNFVIGWTCAESTTNSTALYNLLNTTQTEPGSHAINSVGVQAFTSFTQGIAANAAVLQNGLYSDLLSALKNNYVNWLFPQPTAMIKGDLSTWVTGMRYANIDSYLTNILDENFTTRASEQFQGTIIMGLPATAHDDGTSIHFDAVPFVITLGFRTLYLQMAAQGMIPPDDLPLNNEYGTNPVELNNPAYWVGPGTAQETRYFRFGYSPQRGVHRTYLGQEYQYIKAHMIPPVPPIAIQTIQSDLELLEQAIEHAEADAGLPEVAEVATVLPASQSTGTQAMSTTPSGTVVPPPIIPTVFSSWSPEPTDASVPDIVGAVTTTTTI